MNINRYKMKGLLNLALIISIFLGVNNSISVKSADLAQATSEEVEPKKDSATNNKPPSDNNLLKSTPQEENSADTQITGNSKSTESSGIIAPIQSVERTTTNDQKTLTTNDILLFINLLILTTLSLLWFLNQKKQQQQIDEFTKNQKKIIDSFSQFNEIINKLNKLDQIKLQIIEKIQDSDQKNLDLEIKLREFLSKLQFNQSVNYHNNSTSNTSDLNSIAIVDKVSQLVETYNQNKNLSPERIIATVKSTQENVEQRRIGNIDMVTLENTTKKKYWIIKEDNDCYLIPHAKIRIDEHNKTTLESLFDCTKFTSEYSDFQLVKPAKVSQIDSETWQLEKKGKLEFS